MFFDKPLLGIILMLGFCVIAPLGDALAKLIGQSVALGPMLLIRFAVQVLLLFPFIALSLRPWLLYLPIRRGNHCWGYVAQIRQTAHPNCDS